MESPVCAPIVHRLLSLLYEALLLTAVLFAAGLPYVLVETRAGFPHSRMLFQLYLVLVAGAYFTWQWRHGGQTLPMKTWHIRLVTSSGAPVDAKRAVARYALAALGLLAFGLGFAWALADRDGQFLHDRLAATRLVRG